MSGPHFIGVATVLVEVPDQQQALDFYVGTLGFDKRIDWPSPAGRWIEVAAPGSTTSIALVPPQADGATFGLASTDAAADYAALQAAGVQTGEFIPETNGMPPMFSFVDPAGHRIRVSERRSVPGA